MEKNRNKTSERNISPTCPLDERAVQQHTRAKILSSSFMAVAVVILTVIAIWQSELAGRAIYSIASITGGCVAIAANAVFRYSSIKRWVIEMMIRKSNTEQDDRLFRIADTVRTPSYRDCLLGFIRLKQRIEIEIHSTGELSAESERLEILVDEIIDAVCFEIRRLDILDQQLTPALMSGESTTLDQLAEEQTERYNRILRAHRTLSETCNRFYESEKATVIAETLPVIDRSSCLESAIVDLESENTIANRISSELAIADV